LREHFEAESRELSKIGNEFHIRRFEHDRTALPSLPGNTIDCLFMRLVAFVAYPLRQTERM
jgi:hypothetical protein